MKLKKYQKYYLGKTEVFKIISGKIITRHIISNGKVLINEIYLTKNDIIIDYFNNFNNTKLSYNFEIDTEVEAMENSELEKINIFDNSLYSNKIIKQLTNQLFLNLLYHIYDTKGYILTKLKISANKQGELFKKEIKVENYNLGKTQFYKIYSELKKEEFFVENKDKVILDLSKVNHYLLKQTV